MALYPTVQPFYSCEISFGYFLDNEVIERADGHTSIVAPEPTVFRKVDCNEYCAGKDRKYFFFNSGIFYSFALGGFDANVVCTRNLRRARVG